MDFNEFGWKHCSYKAVVVACDWFGNHFPERLSQIILLSPPAVFSTFHSFVTGTMDANSASKIIILKTDEEKQAHFTEMFSSETSRWLMETSNTPPGPKPYPTGFVFTQ